MGLTLVLIPGATTSCRDPPTPTTGHMDKYRWMGGGGQVKQRSNTGLPTSDVVLKMKVHLTCVGSLVQVIKLISTGLYLCELESTYPCEQSQV